MMLYQFGVAEVLAASPLMERVERVHGTSGGAIAAFLLLERPEAIGDCVDFYTEGRFFEGLTLGDVLSPHDALLRRTFDRLGLLRPGASERVAGRFVARATAFKGGDWPSNVALEVDGAGGDGAILTNISASCCFDFAGVDVAGRRLWDGGLSEPLSRDASLPTVEVSIVSGSAHVSPGGAAPLGVDDAPEAQRHPFLRYDWTPANAVALLEGACLTPARARRRFDQGRADAATFLELSGLPGRAS